MRESRIDHYIEKDWTTEDVLRGMDFRVKRVLVTSASGDLGLDGRCVKEDNNAGKKFVNFLRIWHPFVPAKEERMLPVEFDHKIYAEVYADVVGLNAKEAELHYRSIGIKQGRRSNNIIDRKEFASLAYQGGPVLEIGPLDNPLLRGSNVSYADYFSFEALRKKAITHNRSPETVPDIKYVLGEMTLADIPDRFESVLSSHCIEHQTDLILHFQQVMSLLKPGGRYFILIPDKRYCFDSFKSETTIGDIIESHENLATTHPLRKIIAHFSSMSHNRHVDHWEKPDTYIPPVDANNVRKAIKTWREANGSYLDVHGLYFTPSSFQEIIRLLRELGYIDFNLERLYATRFRKNEFWAVLKAPGADE